MPLLELSFASGEDSLSVRRFTVQESVSSLFSVSVWARSEHADIDLEALVGKKASLKINHGVRWTTGDTRHWAGVCSTIEQLQGLAPQPGEKPLSTYYLRIVPELWLLTQRRNYRIFQHISIPDIVDKVLDEWKIEPKWKIERGKYKKLEYNAQYGESDYAFISRLVEEAGIAFTFPEAKSGSKLTFGDKLHTADPREKPILYVDNPSQSSEKEFVTHVRLAHEVRPGAHVIRDYDFRNPGFALFSETPKVEEPEGKLEQYRYEPGSFLHEPGKGGGGTPVADDKGVARYDQTLGDTRAERDLDAERQGKRAVWFDTNCPDLAPGVIFKIERHAHPDLAEDTQLLVNEFSLEGSPDGEWVLSGHAVFTDVAYRPTKKTPKPVVASVQSAVVVGPKGQEIHTDEFGRVRVQFPWDREGKNDDNSSCWIRVSQGWAGTGFGMMMIPRIKQEVLVGFLEGDPDQPIIVGRVFNNTNPVPYRLPEHKTRSTWRSDSSLGSDGFNEILFEDLKGSELVYVQAEKNLRKLVKNDETITVGRNRQKFVVKNELETTGLNRTEVTGVNRTEITGANRTTIIGGTRTKLVKADETEKTDGNLKIMIGHNHEIVIKQVKRELIQKDSHLRVKGHRRQKIDKTQSLTVGQNQQEKVGKNHALDAGKEIHLKAGTALVIEATEDLTIKGPGGFIRIDAGGVTIRGNLVRINSGGSAGSGRGSSPVEPDAPAEAEIEPPEPPEPDNVAKSGLAQ